MGIYVMRWLSVSLIAWAWVAVVGLELRLKCNHPLCVEDHQNDVNYYGMFGKAIEIKDNATDMTLLGHHIIIGYGYGFPFSLQCNEWHALDSPALPHFINPYNAEKVTLSGCPPPTARSFAEALSTINVKLQQNDDGESLFELKYLPSEPELTAKHFVGLDNLTRLVIESPSQPLQSPKFGFLTGLKNLRDLTIASVPLPDGELTHLSSLRSLTLIMMPVKPLQQMLLTIPTSLRNLTLRYNEIEISNEITKETKVIEPSALENLWLIKWKEQRLVAMERCDSLRLLEFKNPEVEELPERWIVACPRLETLSVYDAEKLTSLPPKLLEGATALKYLTLSNGELQSLPDGLFEGTPNLLVLDLSMNSLRTLSSTAFSGPAALQTLSLESNQLGNEALVAVGLLTSLTNLNIGNNPSIANLCDYNGYSVLQNITQLRNLKLQKLNITHICRDWKENMMFLVSLELQNTQISRLEFSDLQYTRDATQLYVWLYLIDTPITSVHLTEDDYKKAIVVPRNTTMVHLEMSGTKVKCDCSMYWTWAAWNDMKHEFFHGIVCEGYTYIPSLAHCSKDSKH